MNIFLSYNELVCNFEGDDINSVSIYLSGIRDAKSSNKEINKAILKMEYMILGLKQVLLDREEEKEEE